MLYWLAKYLLIGPPLRLIWRPYLEGAENLPTDRPVILASNHLSFSDSFFLPLLVPRKVIFLGKAEYFVTPGLKGWLSKQFFAGVGVVPIDRSGADAAQDALDTGIRVLESGKILGIYPEGTRSPDGRLYRGKTGVARMALEAGVEVIPVAMIDTNTIQPTGRVLPKLRPRPGVRIGKPLDFSRYEGMAGDRFVERSMTDEIMYELMLLSGQEYVDLYAAKVKQAQGTVATFGSNRSAGAQSRGGAPVVSPADVREVGERVPTERAG
ncbi:1-acyl-sn-glycerol-3-phosphate acyltransferase [Frankineae bacterium MT45]|nr:1-acyl-sn-glycerol-3-phosphate acyltransferase [Frankineae bacterium MT45]